MLMLMWTSCERGYCSVQSTILHWLSWLSACLGKSAGLCILDGTLETSGLEHLALLILPNLYDIGILLRFYRHLDFDNSRLFLSFSQFPKVYQDKGNLCVISRDIRTLA